MIVMIAKIGSATGGWTGRITGNGERIGTSKTLSSKTQWNHGEVKRGKLGSEGVRKRKGGMGVIGERHKTGNRTDTESGAGHYLKLMWVVMAKE